MVNRTSEQRTHTIHAPQHNIPATTYSTAPHIKRGDSWRRPRRRRRPRTLNCLVTRCHCTRAATAAAASAAAGGRWPAALCFISFNLLNNYLNIRVMLANLVSACVCVFSLTTRCSDGDCALVLRSLCRRRAQDVRFCRTRTRVREAHVYGCNLQ